jgi:predicted transposase/invertase (TIGR01784 family)
MMRSSIYFSWNFGSKKLVTRKVIKYISQTHKISFDRLEKMLKESKIDGGEIMQTLAQQLREEGKKENTKETAKRMLEKGLDMDTIVEITGLKPSDIEKLCEVSN